MGNAPTHDRKVILDGLLQCHIGAADIGRIRKCNKTVEVSESCFLRVLEALVIDQDLLDTRFDDQVLFLDRGVIDIGLGTQRRTAPRRMNVDDLLRLARKGVEAGFGENDQSDRYGDEQSHRNGELRDQFEIIERSHCRLEICPHFRERCTRPPTRRKSGSQELAPVACVRLVGGRECCAG
jgi:hypothetical protein